MKSKVSSGVWLIFIGTIALLHNFHVIDFNFWAVLKYWPILIISVGINLIFQNKSNGGSILFLANVILCLFLTYQGLTSNERLFNWEFSNNNNWELPNKKKASKNTANDLNNMNVPYQNVDKAKLELNLGAASVHVNHAENDFLVFASSSSGIAGLKIESAIKDKTAELTLNTLGKDSTTRKNDHIQISLHNKPVWDYTFNMGAAAFDADLSAYKIDQMEINAGAADVRLKLGMPYQAITAIEINAAASSTRIDIPKEAACKVETTSFLSANKLKDFIKTDNDHRTENYDRADKKYHIIVNGAANSLKINRY